MMLDELMLRCRVSPCTTPLLSASTCLVCKNASAFAHQTNANTCLRHVTGAARKRMRRMTGTEASCRRCRQGGGVLSRGPSGGLQCTCFACVARAPCACCGTTRALFDHSCSSPPTHSQSHQQEAPVRDVGEEGERNERLRGESNERRKARPHPGARDPEAGWPRPPAACLVP